MSWIDTLMGRTPKAPEPAPLTEAALPVYVDPDDALSASGGGSRYYRRLTQAPRDLPPLQQEKMLQLAFFLNDSNPMAKGIVDLIKNFVVGEGFTVTATARDDALREQVQAIIDRFWLDPFNRMDLELHALCTSLSVAGELFPTVAVNPVNGHVRLGFIDPANVKTVVRDPRNAKVYTDVVLKSTGAMVEERFRVIRIDEQPQSSTHGRLMGVRTDRDGTVQDTYQAGDETRPYAGACFVFQVNTVLGMTRGRSDLLVLTDWIDAIDQILFNEVDRQILMKSFIWDVTLEGFTVDQIQDWLKRNAAPKPGAVRAHNERAKWNAVTPDLKAADTQAAVDVLLSYISTGAGVPKPWLNGTIGTNRATAAEMGEPAFKRLAARQQYVRYLVEQIVAFVLDQAELHGELPRRPMVHGLLPEPWRFTVNVPEMRTKDITAVAAALQQVASALVTAVAEDLLDLQTAQQVLVTLVGQLGVDVDLGEMRERIEQAKAEREGRAATLPYPPGRNGTNGRDADDHYADEDPEGELMEAGRGY